jgi:hypothetical protein
MDTPEEEKKVHDIIPDEVGDIPQSSPSGIRRVSMNAARPRPLHIPRSESYSYPSFKAKQECALRIGIKDLEREITECTGVSHMDLDIDKLTMHLHSQSKLSQQELIDLQKATHFDKKELQQWYKGMMLRDTSNI